MARYAEKAYAQVVGGLHVNFDHVAGALVGLRRNDSKLFANQVKVLQQALVVALRGVIVVLDRKRVAQSKQGVRVFRQLLAGLDKVVQGVLVVFVRVIDIAHPVADRRRVVFVVD